MDVKAFIVSKLFRAYGLYNVPVRYFNTDGDKFQSSFELTGYITYQLLNANLKKKQVSKLFRAYGLYNTSFSSFLQSLSMFQSSFELTGYITYALWKVQEY